MVLFFLGQEQVWLRLARPKFNRKRVDVKLELLFREIWANGRRRGNKGNEFEVGGATIIREEKKTVSQTCESIVEQRVACAFAGTRREVCCGCSCH